MGSYYKHVKKKRKGYCIVCDYVDNEILINEKRLQMKTRVYLVTNGKEECLVEAISIAQALRHVVKSQYTTRVLNSVEVAKAIQVGMKLETACDAREDI